MGSVKTIPQIETANLPIAEIYETPCFAHLTSPIPVPPAQIKGNQKNYTQSTQKSQRQTKRSIRAAQRSALSGARMIMSVQFSIQRTEINATVKRESRSVCYPLVFLAPYAARDLKLFSY